MPTCLRPRRADMRAQRERLLAGAAALPGVQIWPSDANMILVRVPDAPKPLPA
jgi:histidinol-phosphate aminotransferase